MLTDDIKNRRTIIWNIAFTGILMFYAILIIYLSLTINISEDEAYTLDTTSRNLSGVISQSYKFEGQPPIYFVLLSLWRLIDSGILFAKLFSLICTGFSAFVFYRLVQFFSGKECAKWLLIIFLLNPFTVWAALEMRTYSLLILLSSLCVYFFYRYYFEDKKKFLFYFLLVSLIGVYTQYFFLFLIATFALTILVFKGFKPFFQFCLYLIPVVVLFLPNIFFLTSQIHLMKSNRSELFSMTLISNIIYTPLNLTLAVDHVPNHWASRIVRLIFYILSFYIYLKLCLNYFTYKNVSFRKFISNSQSYALLANRIDFPKQSKSNSESWLIPSLKEQSLKYIDFFKRYNSILFSIPILIIFFIAGFVISDVGYSIKYMAIVFPILILLFIVFDNYRIPYNRIIFTSVSVYFLVLLTIHYRHPVKTYDFKSVAKYITKIEKPGEPILIYRPAIALPFRHYYHGKNKIIPIPYPVNYDTSYLINIKDTNQLKLSINSISSPSNKYILLSDTTVFESTVNMNRDMVTDFINSHYNVTLDTLLIGWGKQKSLHIREFEKK